MANNHFEQNALSWGEHGAEWLKNIPSVIQGCEEKWTVKALPPFPLSYNYVAPVTRADGTPAVLKIGFPEDEEFKSEVASLRIFNGDGMAKLIESDPQNSAILIEQVIPGTPLSTLEDDDRATRIIAQVAKTLRKPLPEDHTFINVSDWATAIPEYRKKFTKIDGPLPMNLVVKAEKLFDMLIATSQPAMLLHGDLHHDNVLLSEEHGWVGIDPKGIAAEPAYEVAAMIRNPYEKLKDIPDLEPLLRQRITILAEELELDPQRILDWCFAQTMLSAVWSAEGGAKGPEHALRVAQTLDTITP